MLCGKTEVLKFNRGKLSEHGALRMTRPTCLLTVVFAYLGTDYLLQEIKEKQMLIQLRKML